MVVDPHSALARIDWGDRHAKFNRRRAFHLHVVLSMNMSDKLYFAYGSNLNLADFDAWCRRNGFRQSLLKYHSNARLPNYDLAFTLYAASRKGGVLDLRPSVGRLVPGVLFEVGEEGWKAIDKKEGVPTAYERLAVTVINALEQTVEAITYQVCEGKKSPFVVPDKSYIEIVRQGLKVWGYDDAILLAAAQNQ